MTKDEALRLAIESLCCVRDMVGHPDNLGYIDHQVAKIEAALEAKDEPVALKPCGYESKETKMCRKCGQVHAEAIWDTTPPQRTWVGLTAEEREQVQTESYGKVPHHIALIAAVEAKLKEKNT